MCKECLHTRPQIILHQRAISDANDDALFCKHRNRLNFNIFQMKLCEHTIMELIEAYFGSQEVGL